MGYPFHVVDWWRPFELAGTVRSAAIAATVQTLASLTIPTPPMHAAFTGLAAVSVTPGMHRAPFAGGRRHVAYKVVSDERTSF
jgi:hypothetical protein